jgi:hypothetical protein
MILHILLFVAGTAFAGLSQKSSGEFVEETLRGMLLKERDHGAWEMRQSVLGSAEELRDAVANRAPDKKQLTDRLPGMALDPFEVCRDLTSCPAAPQSLHVNDVSRIDDAFVALARPWLILQKARGKSVTLTVDHGVGVQLDLEDSSRLPVVTLTAAPTPTGGFDVALEAGPDAAQAFAAARADVLK